MADTISNINSRTELFQATTLDLAMNQPEVAAQIIKQWGSQYKDTVGMDFALIAGETAIASETHSVFLEGKYWETMEVAANSAQTGAGNTQDIIIIVDASNRFFPKVGNTVVYQGSNNITGLITEIDVSTPAAPVVTIMPSASVNLPAVVDGDLMVIGSSAWGEGTAQPVASTKTYDRLDFYLQIIKDKSGITGSQLTNQSWVDISEYNDNFNYWNVAMADLDARQYSLEEMALLLGDGESVTVAASTGLTDGEGDNFVQQTKGFIPHITTSGGVDATLTAAAWDITDLDDVDDYFKSVGDASPNILGYIGGVTARAINNELADLRTYSQDPTDSLSQYMGGYGYDEATVGAKAIHLRFMEYATINRIYSFREVWSFSDPNRLGAEGYNYNQYTMWLPLCNVKDGKSSAIIPNVSVMYKELGGYSRRRELIPMQGAGGGVYNMETDKKTMGLRSHIGLAFNNPKYGYLTKPST